MEMQIRDRIGHDLPPNAEGNRYMGREVLVNGEWIPEYWGDATCELPTTESYEDFCERFAKAPYFIRYLFCDSLPFDQNGYHATGREVLGYRPHHPMLDTVRRTGFYAEYENYGSCEYEDNEPEEVFNFRQDEYYFGED